LGLWNVGEWDVVKGAEDKCERCWASEKWRHFSRRLLALRLLLEWPIDYIDGIAAGVPDRDIGRRVNIPESRLVNQNQVKPQEKAFGLVSL